MNDIQFGTRVPTVVEIRGQTKKHSFLEVCCSTAVGFVVALITQLILADMYNLQTSVHDDISIVAIFTVVSIIRSYIFRRIFNRISHASSN